jgi:Phosphotransferase enzyme family
MPPLLPPDPGLPALRGLAADGPETLLARLGLRLGRVEVTVLNHHPGSRCTLLASGETGRVVVKAFAGDVRAHVAVLDRLRSAGLAGGRPPTAPPLLGADAALRVLAIGVLDGPSTWELIDRGQGERAAALAAQWLHRMAALPPHATGTTYDVAALCHDGERWIRSIGRADTALAELAAERLAELAAHAPRRTAVRAIHGSFSPSHVLDLGAGPGVIDWDNAGHGPPEYDVGLFLASLWRGCGAGHARREQVALTSRALLSDVADLVDEEAVRWYEAACLVKLAKYLASRRPPAWRERAEALLARASLTPIAAMR